ncbi:hypothetical protein T484DRAFT_1924270 [Baffinella frigidus]|nr:hypothetical protein T484DRAFT_1924270 [Cryptophyta sp. CCMP2293]
MVVLGGWVFLMSKVPLYASFPPWSPPRPQHCLIIILTTPGSLRMPRAPSHPTPHPRAAAAPYESSPWRAPWKQHPHHPHHTGFPWLRELLVELLAKRMDCVGGFQRSPERVLLLFISPLP